MDNAAILAGLNVAQLKADLARREAMSQPDALMEWIDPQNWARPRHVRFMGDILARVKEGNQRIILQCSVRHGKSYTASWALPVWYLENDPTKMIGMASYQANFSALWSRRVRDTFNEFGERENLLSTRISETSGAAHSWNTTAGGGMHTAGVGGEFTGRGFHLMICDDPIKNWEQANSELQRENDWEWYQTTFRTRLEPGGSIVIIMARWHEDDLTGRLVNEMENGTGEKWTVIDLPCIAGENDQLGRKPGEPLWPERFDQDACAINKAAVGRRAWQALYQQNPRPEAGNRYQRSWFRYATREGDSFALPQDDGSTIKVYDKDLTTYAVADLAQTAKTESDYTARAIIHVTKRHDIIIRDIWHAQADSPTVSRVLRGDYDRWDLTQMAIEDAHWGKTLIQQMQADGLPVKPMRPGTQDKVARSGVAEDMMGAGKIYFLKGIPNLEKLEDELLAFPNGAHDDMVDMVSYAAKLVASLQEPGIVFTEFIDEMFVDGGHILPDLDRFPANAKPHLFVQPGATTGVMLGAVDAENNLIAVDELYLSNADVKDMSEEMTGLLAKWKIDRKKDKVAMLLDPDAVYMRQKEVGVTAGELSAAGWPMGPWMEMEASALDSRLRGLLRDKRALICESCSNLRNEMRHYRRKLDKDGIPMDNRYAGLNYLIRPLRAFAALRPASGSMKVTRTELKT